ncbi:uncharacterized protein LTR77_004124 [Saxophila tyrrhenica]|uniref:Uncharacterized protein n=1 Tax=Saxophila tyrrhenica TaxID=1690608 RepID=A0AAV9PF12_9PEZI|nr:hypothetical protein LTR77_004124 [Saxophila tyrrhenica]
MSLTTAQCSNAPDTTTTDAGVAGAGVLLAFVITAGITLILSTYIILGDFRTGAPVTPKIISRKLVSSFSDQQIIEGIGIQAVGLAKMRTMVPYHFFVIWLLALLSTATHLGTLLALVQDYKRDWVLRWLRQGFMFINLALNVLCGVFVLKSVVDGIAPTLPIGCVWVDGADRSGDRNNKALSVVGTIVVIAVTVILFIFATWYLHLRRSAKWAKWVRLIGIILLSAMAVGAAVRVMMVASAFGGDKDVSLRGPSESSWSFGQLLTLLVLILPFISALEIFRGEIGVSAEQVEDDRQPLNGNELKPLNDRYDYQDNPFKAGSKKKTTKAFRSPG